MLRYTLALLMILTLSGCCAPTDNVGVAAPQPSVGSFGPLHIQPLADPDWDGTGENVAKW